MSFTESFLSWWRHRGAWQRRGLICMAVLLLVWALAAAGVPPLLKWQLERQATDVLGRSVTVEKVRFKPWSLELEVLGLRVAGAQAGAPAGSQAHAQANAEYLVTVDRLYVDAELQSLFRLAPVVDAVKLEGPVLRVRHLGQGRYDLDDILERLRQRPASGGDGQARFALYNLSLANGAGYFQDDATGVMHRLESVDLSIPFLSNLGSKREVLTEPRLAFVLNGSPFESRAQTTPFAESRATQAHLSMKDLDLADYLPYWPQRWPLRPLAGKFQAAVDVRFSQADGRSSVQLAGDLALSDVRVNEVLANGQTTEWLTLQRLEVSVADARPLESLVGVNRIALQAPSVWLRRTADGQTNVQGMLARWAGQAPAARAKNQPDGGSAPHPWRVTLQTLSLADGRLNWHDETLRPAYQTAIEDLSIEAGPASFPFGSPAPVRLAARHAGATLSLEGAVSDQIAQARLELKSVGLAELAPYVRAVLQPALRGALDARVGLDWRAAGQAGAGLTVAVPELRLTDLILGTPQVPQASVKQFRLTDASLDLTRQQVQLGEVSLERPWAAVERDSAGVWMVQRWLHAPSDAASATHVSEVAPRANEASGSTPVAAAQTEPSAAGAWSLGWQRVDVQGGGVRFRDAFRSRSVALDLSGVRLGVGPWRDSADGRTPVSGDMRVALAGAGPVDPGRISWQGQLGWTPSQPAARMRLDSQLTATALPLHGLEPYVADYLNLELLRADAGYRGRVELAQQPEGWKVALRGDVALDDWRANTLSPSEELLAWKSLSVRGLELDAVPGQALRVSVAETALSDWYARIAIDETGRINLQDLIRSQARVAPAESAPAAPAPVAPVAAAATAGSVQAPAQIRFGPVSLVNGRVRFSDRFIKPNYSAELSELTGRLSAFSSQPAAAGAPPDLAELELLGRVEGTASLDLRGRINPLAQPLALDLQGKVRDLELPPLSPYSVKYAGHGIQRGKLSVDVTYRIAPDGQLSATNQIVLNQLSFGDRDPASEAPNLPVRLAVALLADRNGVIDINLPISGSMNDPQFRVGPLIVRLIFNLIGKAVTAPFALLASALGGAGEDTGQVVFAAGTARIDDAARQRLDAVAKALTDRPALRLTVVGHADLQSERQGYQRERVADLVRSEKRRALARAGQAVTGDVVVTDAEYPALLKEVYRRADFPKPRNLIGMAKDIPVAEMEALLQANVTVSEDSMRELALQRSVAVRDYLASRQLPAERLFVGAPQPAASSGNAPPGAPAPALARADLELSAR